MSLPCLCLPTTCWSCNGAQHMLLTEIVVSCCMWRRKEADCFTLMNADCCFARVYCHPSPLPPCMYITVCLDWWILCDFSPFVCKKVLRRRSVVPTTSMRVIIAMLLCTSLWRAWLDENLTNGVGCGVQMYTILDGYYVYMLSCAIPIPLPSVLCTALLRYPHKKCLNIGLLVFHSLLVLANSCV